MTTLIGNAHILTVAMAKMTGESRHLLPAITKKVEEEELHSGKYMKHVRTCLNEPEVMIGSDEKGCA